VRVERHVLAIDLGTSGVKVALVDENGTVAARAGREIRVLLIPPSGAEQETGEIWDAIRSAGQEVVGRAGVPREAIIAVGCTSQYSSIVAVDSEGRPLTNLILWMDGRGGAQSTAIDEHYPGAFGRWVEIHGIPPLRSGVDSLSKMLWVRNEHPQSYERTRCFLEPVDWVLARLTGRFTANVCTAFMMLLTDNRRLDSLEWNPELLGLSGIEREKLPELVPPNSCVATVLPGVAAELGLAPETRVISGTNDTQAAAISTATFRAGQGAVNVGTTGQLISHVGSKKVDLESFLVSMPSPIRGRYMMMAENGVAAKALHHYLTSVVFAKDGLADHSAGHPFTGLDEAVWATPAGAGGLLFLPWLTGTVCPDGNPNARGAFVNVSLETDRARMVRAILEGVAFSLRRVLPLAERFTGESFGELRFSGGGARSEAWPQILADVLDRPVLPLADPVHANNRASALLAFEALGIAGLEDIDRFCPVRGRCEPHNENRGVYDRLFEQFQTSYERLRPVFDALNGREGEP
jgi:xylulokinase